MARVSQAVQVVGSAGEPGDDGDDRRTRLLKAGEAVFTERRYEEVSAQEIAERAGVAHGLLFHYFGSKRNFYFAVLERFSARATLKFRNNTIADPPRWLKRELDVFLTGLTDEGIAFSALIHGSLGAETEAQNIVGRQRRDGAERTIAKLAPERSSALLVGAIAAWIASVNELGAQWIESDRKFSKTQLRTHLTEMLNATLRSVAAIDRTARFDPDLFSRG
jgi:AcrR family transcriptional regulator